MMDPTEAPTKAQWVAELQKQRRRNRALAASVRGRFSGFEGVRRELRELDFEFHWAISTLTDSSAPYPLACSGTRPGRESESDWQAEIRVERDRCDALRQRAVGRSSATMDTVAECLDGVDRALLRALEFGSQAARVQPGVSSPTL